MGKLLAYCATAMALGLCWGCSPLHPAIAAAPHKPAANSVAAGLTRALRQPIIESCELTNQRLGNFLRIL